MAITISSDGNRSVLQWVRLVLGYSLFIALLVYAVRQWPDAVWEIELRWLLLCAVPMLLLALLQALQVGLFLHIYNVAASKAWVFEFAVRRGVLNAVIPGRLGTLIMMREMTRLGGVRWQDYLGFSILQALLAVSVSILALTYVFLPLWQAAVVILAACGAMVLLCRRLPVAYSLAFWPMFALAIAIYLSLLTGFWMVLLALGASVGPVDASYFGIMLNALAQVAITPGNMGVREAFIGLMAKYTAVPVITGILASAVFQALRIAVYSIGILLVRFLCYWNIRRSASGV